MKDLNLHTLLNTRRNPLRSGEKHPYQVLKEDFYEMVRHREMGFDELGLAIYLRGKACRFGNPFRLANQIIYEELKTTKRIFLPLRRKLKLKGIIKYNSGDGKGHWTQYTMIDSVMVHKRDRQ